MEYFFCDTGAELPETYEYLNKLEVVLGKPIARLNSDKGFDHWFEVYRGTLPSPQMRWCTRQMKIKPLEEWLGDDEADQLRRHPRRREEPQGLRLDQAEHLRGVPLHRRGDRPGCGACKILDDAGVGLPDYYEWRTRSGCYFCFYQRKAEWVGLAERHPELFERAKAIEQKMLKDAGADGDASYQATAMQGRAYTWSPGETLDELLERRDEIMEKHEAAMERARKRRKNIPLVEVLSGALDEDDDSAACTVCAL